MNITRRLELRNVSNVASEPWPRFNLTLQIIASDTVRRDFITLTEVRGAPIINITGTRVDEDGTELSYIRQPLQTLIPVFSSDPKLWRIFEFWEYWHLHELRQGTQAQLRFIDGYKHAIFRLAVMGDESGVVEQFVAELEKDYFRVVADILATGGFKEDRGHIFGNSYLIEVPSQQVIDNLVSSFDAVNATKQLPA